jgi:UDP:flavonoid glycosyltransferase YjiC (YdhE family)
MEPTKSGISDRLRNTSVSTHLLVIGDGMSLAHVGRALVAARRLAEAGYKITFATSAHFKDFAVAEGWEPEDIYCVDPKAALAAIRRGSHIFNMATLKRYVASDIALIERVQPDAIVADMRMSLNVAGPLTGTPYYNILNAYFTRYYAGLERPPRTFPLVRLLGQNLSQAMFPLLKRMTLKYYAYNFGRYRKTLGLEPVRDVFDVIASPHGNLIADLPELMPCRDLPSHFKYVGPLIWEPHTAPPDWLGRIDPDRQTAYVTMGSTGGPSVFRRVLETLVDAGYQVLTTTGGQVPSIPDGVLATEYAPGSELLKRSHVTICHGGSLTIYQALSYGVPVVGVPTFHDQEYNLGQLERCGLGVELSPGRWRRQELLELVNRALPTRFHATRFAISKRIHDYAVQPADHWIDSPSPSDDVCRETVPSKRKPQAIGLRLLTSSSDRSR